MSEIDELIEKARERDEAQIERLKEADKGVSDRLASEREARERLSKAIGEKFPGTKNKVLVEMEAYFAEKDEQKRFARKQEFAESLGLTMQQLDAYLNLRGENQ